MSQSDYIAHKKVAAELSMQNKLKPVLDSDTYIAYKQFQMANSVYNTSRRTHQLIPSGEQTVFSMPMMNVGGCSTFVVCKNTNTRPFRVPMSAVYFLPSYGCACPPVYTKHRKLTTCAKCCYGDSGATKTNGANTHFADCGNRRLKGLYCKCSEL
jgi:hypothetical protein